MLEILNREAAEELLRRAIQEIKIEGSTTLDIVANKRKQDARNYIVEVGIRKDFDLERCPSNDGLIKVKHNDELLKLVNTYQEMIA